MSILEQFNQRMAAASKKMNLDLSEGQGSYAWVKSKLGVVTASEVTDILKGTNSETYKGYMAIKIAEIATGNPVDAKRISAKELEWGRIHEVGARENYCFESGNVVSTFPIVHSDDLRCAFSPDGLIESLGRGVEIKCPWNTRYHVQAVTDGTIKKEYMDQIQYSIWLSGINEWDFVSFDPRMNKRDLFFKTIERSDKYMKLFDDAVPQFCLEMDRKLQLVGFEFGDQWK
ncbi:MAG: YqaJ viral recombinase family protein [Plesiomonas shigelloides]